MSQKSSPSSPSSAQERASHRQASRSVKAFWYSMLVLFGVVSIWWPLYNKVEPMLWGIPFFLWFQFAWISLSAVATALAYKMRA